MASISNSNLSSNLREINSNISSSSTTSQVKDPLPFSVRSYIFSYLPPQEMEAAQLTCKAWKTYFLAKSDGLPEPVLMQIQSIRSIQLSDIREYRIFLRNCESKEGTKLAQFRKLVEIISHRSIYWNILINRDYQTILLPKPNEPINFKALEVFNNLKDLTVNGISSNLDSDMESIKSLPFLQTLEYCATNKNLAYITSLTDLRTLNLSQSSLTDDGLKVIVSLTHLTHLNLEWCRRITNSAAAFLRFFTALRELNLKDCNQITDDGLTSIASLTYRTNLNLGGCTKITNYGVSYLQSLTALQHLNLFSTKIDNGFSTYIITFTALKTLDLIHCYEVTETCAERIKTYFDQSLYRTISIRSPIPKDNEELSI